MIVGIPILFTTFIESLVIGAQIANPGDWSILYASLIPASTILTEIGIGTYIEYKLTDKKYKLIDNLKLKIQLEDLDDNQKEIVKEARKNSDIVYSIQQIANLNLNEDNLDKIKIAVLDKDVSKTICYTNFETLRNYDFDNEEKYDKEYEKIMTKRPKQKIKSKFKRDNRE